MNITYESRTIRIFISSTFEDMKEERNYLITKIFPKLAAEAAKRDVTLIPLDLRWGISEEESRTGKVIEICLQEIEQSRPFFIGLLGNRYGWCPPKEELQKNTALQERYNWVEADISEGLSVTEMEIQYGALRNPEKIDAFFYIRNDGQAEGENAEKLKRLKNEVRNNRRYPVSEYRTVEELGSEVKGFRKGDRVTVNVETFCGECYFCRHGYVNNCTSPHGGWALGCRIDGGQAEYVRVPLA